MEENAGEGQKEDEK